jgi:hypothetical protein
MDSPPRLWGEDEVEKIRAENIVLYQSEIGQKLLRMLRHFQGGDRTGPHADSPIWILEILQNALDAGARKVQIYHLPEEQEGYGGFLITHDNFHRMEKGITLQEFNALCNISTTTKSLTSVGFFGIGFKSIFYLFERVSLSVVSAPGGHVCLDVGGGIPLERSDLLKSVLPTWVKTPLPIPSTVPLLDTSFYLTGCRLDESSVARSISSFLSNTSLLKKVLQLHGLEELEYYAVGCRAADSVPTPMPSQGLLETFVMSVPWRPTDLAYAGPMLLTRLLRHYCITTTH